LEKITNNITSLLTQSSNLMEDDPIVAIDLAHNAEKIALEHFNTKGLADSLKQIALCYSNASNYAETMKAALHAKELYQSTDNYKGEAECLNILGGVYNFLKDYHKRLECNLECLALREKANDMKGQLSTYNNIGDTYTVMGDYENAIRYFNICLTFPDLTTHIKAIVNHNIGEVHFFKKEFEQALTYFEIGLNYGIESNYWQIIIASSAMKADIFITQGEDIKALEILEYALDIAQRKKSKKEQIPLFNLFAKVYNNLANFEKAFYYLNLHNQYRDELEKENSAQKLKKIEFEFQFKAITSETEEIKKKNKQLTHAFNQIEIQRNEIETKNIAITDSIHYAKRIQLAILPNETKLNTCLENYFVFYQPKDIVSGDFYWVENIGSKVVFAIIDCTGHGVPGAFVSLIAFNLLNKVVLEHKMTSPKKILTTLNKAMINQFKKSESAISDGFDIGICCWDKTNHSLQFAGANHSLFIASNSELMEIKGTKSSIGYSLYERKVEFIEHEVLIKKGNTIYLSTDGLPDQFGGERGKKLKWKGLKNWLVEIHPASMNNQKNKVHQLFKNWKKDQEQVDDVCMLSVTF